VQSSSSIQGDKIMHIYSKSIASLLFSTAVFGLSTVAMAQAVPPRLTQSEPVLPEPLLVKNIQYTDGVFVGPTTDAYYGPMQVQVTVKGGRIVAVEALQYPDHRSTSRAINDEALPILQQEVIAAQYTRINAVSGATLTSRAYLQSAAAALRQAGG
jgi:uncharacterized protein with FMN-binding domain